MLLELLFKNKTIYHEIKSMYIDRENELNISIRFSESDSDSHTLVPSPFYKDLEKIKLNGEIVWVRD